MIQFCFFIINIKNNKNYSINSFYLLSLVIDLVMYGILHSLEMFILLVLIFVSLGHLLDAIMLGLLSFIIGQCLRARILLRLYLAFLRILLISRFGWNSIVRYGNNYIYDIISNLKPYLKVNNLLT